MAKTSRPRAADLRGINRLTIDGIVGLVDLVEAMHCNIASIPGLRARRTNGRTGGITGLVYRSIRGVSAIVSHGLDSLLARVEPLLPGSSGSQRREMLLAVLNGVLGDHLDASRNPLATAMRLRRGGIVLPIERQALAAAIPRENGKLVVLLHGLCMNDSQWKRKGHDHGTALERDLGYTPVYLQYNSGLHISTNGRAFAEQLETLVEAWPVRVSELVLLGHSMGGLVARSACHYAALARHGWLRHLDKLVFLGTPHHGAPLERGGSWVDLLLQSNPYSGPLARLGRIRSAGITDLRFGNLLDEDWKMRGRFEYPADRRASVPLPKGVACYAIAATTGRKVGGISDRLLGDGIVPVTSALGRHPDPQVALRFDASRQWVASGTHHFGLLDRPAVYAKIRQWLEAGGL